MIPVLRMFVYTKVWFERGLWRMFLVVVVRNPQTFSAWSLDEKFCSTLRLWLIKKKRDECYAVTAHNFKLGYFEAQLEMMMPLF